MSGTMYAVAQCISGTMHAVAQSISGTIVPLHCISLAVALLFFLHIYRPRVLSLVPTSCLLRTLGELYTLLFNTPVAYFGL